MSDDMIVALQVLPDGSVYFAQGSRISVLREGSDGAWSEELVVRSSFYRYSCLRVLYSGEMLAGTGSGTLKIFEGGSAKDIELRPSRPIDGRISQVQMLPDGGIVMGVDGFGDELGASISIWG
jgi:hypothetical protein